MGVIGGVARFDGRPLERGELEGFGRFLARCTSADLQISYSVDRTAAVIASRREQQGGESERQSNGRDLPLIAADLRIDDRASLAARLGVEAPHVAGTSDDELAALAYARWGIEFPAHVGGDFALGVWDSRKRSLMCTRDRIGNRPLFYAWNRDVFAFASVARSLLMFEEVSSQLSEEHLADALVQLPSSPESTHYRDVLSLPPGHVILVDERGIRTQSYWSLVDVPDIRLSCDEEYQEAFRERLGAAVSARIGGEERVGAFVSGGLDSPSIAAVAAHQLGEQGLDLRSFTNVPRRGFKGRSRIGRIMNEQPLVEDFVKWTGNVSPSYITMEGKPLLASLEDLFPIAGPPRNLFHLCWDQAIAEAAQSAGIRIMLNAGGGNFAMSRDGFGQLAALARTGRWVALRRELLLARKFSGASFISSLGSAFPAARTQVEGFQGALASRGLRRPPEWAGSSAISGELIRAARLEHRLMAHESRCASVRRMGRRHAERVRVAEAFRSSSQAYGTVWQALHGIENVDPSRDARLVSFCMGVGDDQYFKDGVHRSLLRRSMRGRLPPSITSNARLGAQSVDWMHNFHEESQRLAESVTKISKSELVRHCLDVGLLRRLIESWKSPEACPPRAAQQYRDLFCRGLTMGLFLEWHEWADDLRQSSEGPGPHGVG